MLLSGRIRTGKNSCRQCIMKAFCAELEWVILWKFGLECDFSVRNRFWDASATENIFPVRLQG